MHPISTDGNRCDMVTEEVTLEGHIIDSLILSKVLDEIRGVKGLPLLGSFTVVTKLGDHKLGFEVKKIETVEVHPSVFELNGAKKIERTNQTLCAECGRPGEKNKMKAVRFRQLLHFCDARCRDSFMKKQLPAIDKAAD